MAYNTKALTTDLNGKPVPQEFDSAADVYKPIDQADAAATNATGSWSTISLLKGLLKIFLDVWDDASNSLRTLLASEGTGGAAVPSKMVQVGGSDGANLRALQVDSSGVASVNLKGSKVTHAVLTSTPLAAGTSWDSGATYIDCTDGRRVGFIIKSDTVVKVRMDFAADSAGTVPVMGYYSYEFVVDPTTYNPFIPPIRVAGYIKVTVTNPTAGAQANLSVYAVYDYRPSQHGQGLRPVLAKGFAPRDNVKHSPYTAPDGQTIFAASIEWLGNGTHPLFVKNTLDQQISVNIVYAVSSTVSPTLGTFTVAAGASALKTNQDFPGLDIPTRRLFLEITPAVIPTAGDVTAYTEAVAG